MTDFTINSTARGLGTEVDTLIHVILDASSSMRSIQEQTRVGLNEYLNTVRAKAGTDPNSRTLISITQFDSDWTGLRLRPIVTNLDSAGAVEVGKNDFTPEGMTPLYEAIGTLVEHTDALAKSSPTPPAVMIVIVTDGGENSSRKYNLPGQIKELISAKTNIDKWTFMFLGANQDSFAEGAVMGIHAGNTVNYDAANVGLAFVAMAASSSAYAMSNSAMRSVTGKSAIYETSEAFAEANIDNSKKI